MAFHFLKKKENSSLKNLQTFTYFIPAPPFRTTGYQEKELDKVLFELCEKGYQIVDIKTQSISPSDNQNCSGMWVICLLQRDPHLGPHLMANEENYYRNDEIQIEYPES